LAVGVSVVDSFQNALAEKTNESIAKIPIYWTKIQIFGEKQ